jgi:hypothetical protein
MQLSRKHKTSRCKTKAIIVNLACTRQVEASLQYPRTMTYGLFAKRTDPPSSSLLVWWSPPPSGLRRLPSVTRLSPRFEVLFSRPNTDRVSLAISLTLIGPLTPMPPGDSASPPEVTRCSSVPCRPQTPWCGGRMRTPLPSYCRLDRAPPLADRFIFGVAPHRNRNLWFYSDAPLGLRISSRTPVSRNPDCAAPYCSQAQVRRRHGNLLLGDRFEAR